MADVNTTGKALDWEDEIEKDSEFVLLPEGDYDFTVITFERGRHPGSEKLPPCNKAIVHIQVVGKEGKTTIKHQLFLHTITEGMLSSFFNAIGQKKHGEKLQMNWNSVIGSTGRCKVYIDKWKNDNGDEFESNKIKKFYDPAATPTQQASTGATFTPGAF